MSCVLKHGDSVRPSAMIEGGKQRRGISVVAESLTDMREAIDVPWPKDEAPAKLKRITA